MGEETQHSGRKGSLDCNYLEQITWTLHSKGHCVLRVYSNHVRLPCRKKITSTTLRRQHQIPCQHGPILGPQRPWMWIYTIASFMITMGSCAMIPSKQACLLWTFKRPTLKEEAYVEETTRCPLETKLGTTRSELPTSTCQVRLGCFLPLEVKNHGHAQVDEKRVIPLVTPIHLDEDQQGTTLPKLLERNSILKNVARRIFCGRGDVRFARFFIKYSISN